MFSSPVLQVCGMLVWILVGGTEYFHLSALCWGMFVSVLCWVLTVCLFIIYLTGAHNRIPQVPWTTLVTHSHTHTHRSHHTHSTQGSLLLLKLVFCFSFMVMVRLLCLFICNSLFVSFFLLVAVFEL